jgi:hypothetical protein
MNLLLLRQVYTGTLVSVRLLKFQENSSLVELDDWQFPSDRSIKPSLISVLKPYPDSLLPEFEALSLTSTAVSQALHHRFSLPHSLKFFLSLVLQALQCGTWTI